ncbi:MAG: RNA methyltransferase [Verrucomicrobiales bacterium]
MPEPVVVEGRWAVEALLESTSFTPLIVYVERGRHQDLKQRLVDAGVAFEEVDAEAMAGKAGFDFHRGVFALAERPEAREPAEEWLENACRMVVPVGLADPGNLGTIVRSAAAFGADGILLEKGRGADVYSRKCIRASATAVFRLPIFEVERLPGHLDSMREAGFAIFGTALGDDAVPLPRVRQVEKCALLFGSERDGLAPEVGDLCDEKIGIPMSGTIDSLNVAASAAVVMYELFVRAAGRDEVNPVGRPT